MKNTAWACLVIAGCVAAEVPSPPPPGPLVVELPGLYPGHEAPVLVTGGQAWERVFVGSSDVSGQGPCPPILGGACLGIPQPQLIGVTWSNADGEAAAMIATPVGILEGTPVCVQAAIPRGPGGRYSSLSNVACGIVRPADACLSGNTTIAIGTGETSFSALTPGQDFAMVSGPQGGWHMPLAVRVTGSTDTVIADFRITDVTTGLPLTPTVPLQYPLPLGSCGGDATDIFGFLDFSALTTAPDPWQSLCGREVRIDAVVRDLGGLVLSSASIEVIAQPDPSDGPPCTP